MTLPASAGPSETTSQPLEGSVQAGVEAAQPGTGLPGGAEGEGSGAEPARRRRRRRGGRGRGQDAAQSEGQQADETVSAAGGEELPEASVEQAPAQRVPTEEAPAHAAFASEGSEPARLEASRVQAPAPLPEPSREPAAGGTEPMPPAMEPLRVAPVQTVALASEPSAAQAELPLAPAAQVLPAVAPETPRPLAAAVTPTGTEPATLPEADAAQAPATVSATAGEALPVEQLRAVVETAGLQWVQSDPERVEQARRKARQAPAPRHAPRERKPRAAQDEGPLVLVETRKALPRLELPENEQPAP